MNTDTVTTTPTAKPERKSRKDIRNAIFNHKRAKRQIRKVNFFDQDLELRQPTLGEVLSMNDEDIEIDEHGEVKTNTRKAAVSMLIKYAYIPGTEERVFENADEDVLLDLPFGQDFQAVNKAFEELTTLAVGDEAKNSEGTQPAGM